MRNDESVKVLANMGMLLGVSEVMEPFERRPGTGKSLHDGCIADRYSEFELVVYMYIIRLHRSVGGEKC